MEVAALKLEGLNRIQIKKSGSPTIVISGCNIYARESFKLGKLMSDYE